MGRPVWRVHFRLAPDLCRHVDHVAGVLTHLTSEGLRRRYLHINKQTGVLQAGHHS